MKKIWQETTMIANICALPIILLIGGMADKVSPKIMAPGILIIQIVTCSLYYFIEAPNSWAAYTEACFLNGIA